MCLFATTLVSVFLCLAVVSAGKSDIMTDEATDSWLSVENLTTLVEVSFTVSKCCNAFIIGKSAGTENIFNKFSKIYQHEYVVNSRTYDCSGYFMISEIVDSLVAEIKKSPTTISTTELLIIVDDNIEDVSGLFNTSIYENANVNIVAPNGLWSLSDSSIDPRVFEKLSRPNEMVHKRGILNFRGRELSGATLSQTPWCYLETTFNRTVNGIQTEFFDLKKSELDGIEIKLFMLMAERLNFTWNLRRPNSYERYGYPNGTHWEGGTIGMLSRKEVDIAFGSIWLTNGSYRFANMTTPWAQMRVHFLVPRPKQLTSFWAITRPLSAKVWFAVIAMLMLQSFYVYTSAWISPRITRRFRSFTVTWTELIGRLIGTGAPREMRGLEIQFQLWHFIGILMVTAYSSSLAADLTNSNYEKRIDTPRDFMKANLTWGQQGSLPSFSLIFNENDRYTKRFRHRYVTETSDDDRHEKMSRGNYAVIGIKLESRFYPEDPVRPADLKDYRVMKQHLSQYYATFAVQPWLLKSADTVMLWMKEVGLVNYHVHDVIYRRTGNALREVVIEHDGYSNVPRVLKLTPLAAGFSMLLVGLAISTVVFFIELYSHS